MAMPTPPVVKLDGRFSSPDAEPAKWREVTDILDTAELYWLTTVRADGRPHVTPLIGVWDNGAIHFCTGLDEQKARNLEHHSRVVMTTGTNTWAQGFDVVVEGVALRVTDRDRLQTLADAYEAKYGSEWHFDIGDGVFDGGDHVAAVFRVEPVKVLAFAKEPHAQTTFLFTASDAAVA